MSSKVLDFKEIPTLQPTHGLKQLYQPEKAPFRFTAANLAEAAQWQTTTRQHLQAAIGFDQLPDAPLTAQQIEEVDKGDYVRQKWLLQTWQHAHMPVYILIPKTRSAPFKTVAAIHGHGYGVKDIVGLWEDGGERDTPDGYHKDFAVALCRKGFLVAAPEVSCFGERRTDFASVPGFQDWQTCTYTARYASYLGGTPLGLRMHDARKLLDYLVTRADVDCERIGVMGISGGGLYAFYAAALDERIKAAVISGYYCTYRSSILAMNHCDCNYFPGMGNFGEIYDLIGLLAPRPILVESGDHDDIFPRNGVEEALAIARQKVYAIWNASGQIEHDYFEGRHQISGAIANEFLWRSLSNI